MEGSNENQVGSAGSQQRCGESDKHSHRHDARSEAVGGLASTPSSCRLPAGRDLADDNGWCGDAAAERNARTAGEGSSRRSGRDVTDAHPRVARPSGEQVVMPAWAPADVISYRAQAKRPMQSFEDTFLNLIAVKYQIGQERGLAREKDVEHDGVDVALSDPEHPTPGEQGVPQIPPPPPPLDLCAGLIFFSNDELFSQPLASRSPREAEVSPPPLFSPGLVDVSEDTWGDTTLFETGNNDLFLDVIDEEASLLRSASTGHLRLIHGQ